MKQPDLFGNEPDELQLTPRQRAAFDLVRSTPGGVGADQVGALWHSVRGRHSADSRCQWCTEAGTAILRSRALRPFVVRRRGGRWEPRGTADGAARPGAQLERLPGETFEDIFGDAA